MPQKLDFYGKKKDSTSGLTKYLVIILLVLVAAIAVFTARAPAAPVVTGNPFASYTDNGTKVSLVEFADFECPYCAQVQPTVESLRLQYAGKINYVYKHFPVHGDTAEKAAEASECAREQGLFDPYHSVLFQNQASLTLDSLKRLFAAQAGADTAKFNSCLDSGRMADIVTANQNEGVSVGVQATPTFFVDGIKLEGASDITVFQQAIDSELAKIGAK